MDEFKIYEEEFELEVILSRNCSPVTVEQIKEFLVSNKNTKMFQYDGYWKYEFSVCTEAITINGESFVIKGRVGGSAEYIYRFSPEDTTLCDDFNLLNDPISAVYIKFL